MAKKPIAFLAFTALAMAGTAQAQSFRPRVNAELATVSNGRCASIPHLTGFGAGAATRVIINECFANLYRERGLTYQPIENDPGLERAFNQRLARIKAEK